MSTNPPTAGSTADVLRLREARRDRQTPAECTHCGRYLNPNATVKSEYHSYECYIRDRGAKALNRLASDHTLCSTCFRPIKTIERPPDDSRLSGGKELPECVVGYQYPTEHMEVAVDDFADDPYRRLERTRWGCECGNVDPSQRDDILETVELQTVIVNLYRALQELAAKDAIDETPSWPRLRDTLRTQGRDWELAVGAALYDS